MKKYIHLIALSTLFFISCLAQTNDCYEDVNDPRGKMKPWEKGAWATGVYRNVFLEAGYKREDILISLLMP